MLNYQEALDIVLQTVQPLAAREVDLSQALGRVLAESVQARWNLPPSDNSAMDGFAFCLADQSAGARLPVAGFIPAGASRQEPVPHGAAVKIMTGAPLPPDCDTVVPNEEVEQRDDSIVLRTSPSRGQHVRLAGEEIRRSEILLEAGTPVLSGEMGLLAAGGADRVRVIPAPRVALLSTGDELVELGQQPGPGQIVNSNTYLLSARLREEGCEVIPLGIARDTSEDLAIQLARGLEADLLITTGGVSAGDRDYVQETLGRFGFSCGFWKVAIKPGKPVLFGTAQGKPVFGLPGNPAASGATFELFVRPALRRLAGFRDPLPPRLRVTLGGAISGGEKRQRFVWGTLKEAAGRYEFIPSDRQGSGQNRSMQGAQALLPVPGGSPPLEAGAETDVLLMRLPPGLAWPVPT
ncbi:molybdopterin molybdenumtransferase MoeA [Desulfuromonas versatilis]|uniref:Molybdopterin molybdenumtransferase n=1 Tax=Desulfuromonas versatilis TaxID=2802975 RepID=A0ABM8HMV5_9BACT|nr:gephyrin-like molybdotransferase Glp [Desulfuromonas versatilis]BCR03672.1 molybdopterin molybdenumtransferase MoeA [Desulfuromonas versatilis]